MLAAWVKGTEKNLFPLWSRTIFKPTFDEFMNKRHWSGLYSWSRTSKRNKRHCKTRHRLPERRNPWIFHGAHGKNTFVSWRRRFQPFNLEPKSSACFFDRFKSRTISFRSPWVSRCGSLVYIFVTWLTGTQRKVWVIEKFWKHTWIQHPKIHQKQTFYIMGQNFCWPV